MLDTVLISKFSAFMLLATFIPQEYYASGRIIFRCVVQEDQLNER